MKSKKYSGPVYSYIRFSSGSQSRGDSVRRQTDKAKKWCEERGLKLDNSLRPDRAMSAYRGDNLKRGHLGAFLKKVEDGLVPRGATLLVENLDRLSRSAITSSFPFFMKLISDYGIRVVTLMDGKEFTRESIEKNPDSLYMTIGTLARGHDESQTKSDRGKEAFAKMRSDLPEKKWPTNFPPWLELNKERTQFTVIEEKAEVIRRIFRDFDQGIGVFTIARNLQAEGIGRLTDGKCLWQTSNVQHYLQTRSVIGEFQPKERVLGKRVPVGLPLVNYFPKIVEDAQFFRVNRKLRAKKKVRGRRSKAITNLFRGVLKCGYCGSPMLLRRQVREGKNDSDSYVCDQAIRFQRCLAFSWDRVEFERTFLEITERVQDEYLQIPLEKPNPTELEDLEARFEEVELQLARMLDLYQQGVFELAKVKPRVESLRQERDQLSNRKLHLEVLASGSVETQRKLDLAQFLNVDLNDSQKRDLLAGVIERLFEKIVLYHVGLPSRQQQLLAARRKMVSEGMTGIQVFHKLAKVTPFQRERFFVAHFNDPKVPPYPDFLKDEIFIEMFEDKKAAEKELREILQHSKSASAEKEPKKVAKARAKTGRR